MIRRSMPARLGPPDQPRRDRQTERGPEIGRAEIDGAEIDLLVVGGGPVGAVLAQRAISGGLSVLVVERDPAVVAGPYPLPRAVAADDEVQLLLSRTAPGCLDGALVDQQVRLLDGRRRELGRLCFPLSRHGFSGLAFFDQPALEDRLRVGLDLRCGSLVGLSQDADGVDAALADGSVVRASWVVGCDGASSSVRSLAGLGWRGRDLTQPWLVCDVAGSVPERRLFTYTCDPAQPQVDLPTPRGHRWEWLGAAPSALPELLARDVDPATVEVQRAVVYRFGARRAVSWRSGRVLLAGDAAHTMPPFAGQGLGAGVRDAWSLGWRLAAGLVDGYEAERMPHVREMTRLSLAVGAALQTRSASAAGVRDLLLRQAFATPRLGPWLSRGGPRSSVSGVWEATPASLR